MTLEASFATLGARLRTLQDSLVELRLAAVDAKPPRGDLVLVDVYGDGTDELLGCVEEALAAIDQGARAVRPPLDLDRARRALAACHDCYGRLSRHYAFDLAQYDRVADLAGIGRRRGEDWGLWALNVKQGLDRCQAPLFDVQDALLDCWREIGERVGMTSVSVHATNIGQLTAGEPIRDGA